MNSGAGKKREVASVVLSLFVVASGILVGLSAQEIIANDKQVTLGESASVAEFALALSIFGSAVNCAVTILNAVCTVPDCCEPSSSTINSYMQNVGSSVALIGNILLASLPAMFTEQESNPLIYIALCFTAVTPLAEIIHCSEVINRFCCRH